MAFGVQRGVGADARGDAVVERDIAHERPFVIVLLAQVSSDIRIKVIEVDGRIVVAHRPGHTGPFVGIVDVVRNQVDLGLGHGVAA
jgi:hypothetical protein